MAEWVEICKSIDVPMEIQNIGHSRIDWVKIRSCTAEQKRSMVPYAERLVNYQRGILAGYFNLSGLFDHLNDDFERYGVFLLRVGWDYEIIAELLYNVLSSTDLSALDYLKYAMFTRFVLMEKIGHHGRSTLRAVLLSYLGEQGMVDDLLPDWVQEDVKLYEQLTQDGWELSAPGYELPE